MDSRDRLESRRQLPKWLSASPLLACPGLAALAADGAPPAQLPPQDPRVWAPASLQDLITNPMDAINVFDFEPAMRKNVPPALELLRIETAAAMQQVGAPSIKHLLPTMVRRA